VYRALREVREVTLARGVLHPEKIKRLPKSTILALGVGFIVVAAALGGAARESYRRAATMTASVPEQRYLAMRASRLR